MITTFLKQHENYSQNPFRGYPNDACMLKLTTEVDTTEEGVGLACIPDESFGDFSDNDECWISGWGLTGCKYWPRFPDHYERLVILWDLRKMHQVWWQIFINVLQDNTIIFRGILFQGWMTRFQIFYKRERFQSRQMRNVRKVTSPTGSFCKTFTSVLVMEIPVPAEWDFSQFATENYSSN